ncbi:MAG: STAS/SEC14 domain-containing protein [Cytophagales bacterium]|nr:STAS/SEC14 domain-containing protein [Cytophagales bacterium]MDW8383193.1 STAS/SEC14 domain-containing protein [Flammeovirgaceae bacterium]
MNTNLEKVPYAVFDDSKFPIIKVIFSSKEPSDKEFDEFLAQFEIYLKRQKTYLVIFDTRLSSSFPNRLIKRIAAWMRFNETKIRQYAAGAVFIINNLSIRMALKTIFLLKTPPISVHIAATEEEALAWVENILENIQTHD